MSVLGSNIRILRRSFGETQEQLGAVIGYEKNTVSQYESGNRLPDYETIRSIAEHYMITVDDLISMDLGSEYHRREDAAQLVRGSAESAFPAVTTEEALRNERFRRAYGRHLALLKDYDNDDVEDCLDDCADAYMELLDDPAAKDASAANLLSLLLLMQFEAFSVYAVFESEQPPAPVDVDLFALSRDLDDPEELRSDMMREADRIRSELNDPEVVQHVQYLITTLKRSTGFSDLGDYYLTLSRIFDLRDGGRSTAFRIKEAMGTMRSLAECGNRYAKRLIALIGSLSEPGPEPPAGGSRAK